MKQCIENSDHSIWAHSGQVINTDSFSACPHSPLSGRGIAGLTSKMEYCYVINVIVPLIHLVFNPQNVKDEVKGQKTEPRQMRKDVSKDWLV